MLWLGLSEGGDELLALAKSVEQALRRHGFDAADRSFQSHLTLGRVRERDQDWSDRLSVLAASGPAFTVDRVAVVKSTLSPKGSIYETAADAALKGDG